MTHIIRIIIISIITEFMRFSSILEFLTNHCKASLFIFSNFRTFSERNEAQRLDFSAGIFLDRPRLLNVLIPPEECCPLDQLKNTLPLGLAEARCPWDQLKNNSQHTNHEAVGPSVLALLRYYRCPFASTYVTCTARLTLAVPSLLSVHSTVWQVRMV